MRGGSWKGNESQRSITRAVSKERPQLYGGLDREGVREDLGEGLTKDIRPDALGGGEGRIVEREFESLREGGVLDQ